MKPAHSQRSHWIFCAFRFLLIFFFCLSTLAAICTAAQSPQGISVNFICNVTDEAGRPLSDAEIRIHNAAGDEIRRGKTDENGRFEWNTGSLPAGRYVIEAFHRTGGFDGVRFAVEAGGTSNPGVVPQTVVSVLPERESDKTRFRVEPGATQTMVHVDFRLRGPMAAMAAPPRPAAKNGGGANWEFTTVKVFYATDRNRSQVMDPKNYYGTDRGPDGSLALGTCEVSIPRDHQLGAMEAPCIWRLEIHEDPKKHVVLMSVHSEPEDAFFSKLSESVDASPAKDAFVFIHGFNVSFEGAARRTAQIWYDLGFKGAPIFYSWPSKASPSPAAYTADEAVTEWTAPHLKMFLEKIAARSHATTVHLIAHSMGNRPLTNALKALATETRTTAMPHFRQVVLAAPDVDAGVFRQLAAAIQQTADRITLYASSEDEALKLSQELHAFGRAGESGNGIVVVPGIDTVDVSALDTGLLGHSYYGDNGAVITDLFRLIRDGLGPEGRSCLFSVPLGNLAYWQFRIDERDCKKK